MTVSLTTWTARQTPAREPIVGNRVRLDPIDPARHATQLFAAIEGEADTTLWDYLPYGPFADEEAFRSWLQPLATSSDPLHFAIVDRATGAAVGMCAYLRMDPDFGVIEIGHIWFSPALQRTTLATEAIFLLQEKVLGELGYRRLEWKCDNANERSKRAAVRFGFTFEGVFRQHRIVKGKNRDTAWFSLLDNEWPANERAMRAWLDPGNFDEAGRQLRSLAEIRTGR